MNIVAFAGSNSSRSINGTLVAYAARLIESGEIPGLDDAKVDILDLNDYEMPLFGVDRQERDGIPAAAGEFLAKIREADAIIISFAEHNGSYTVAFKNVFDWASRVDAKVYSSKPTVMLATSPGPGGGRFVLETATTQAPYRGAELRGSLFIPRFSDAFDADQGELVEAQTRVDLVAALAGLGEAPTP